MLFRSFWNQDNVVKYLDYLDKTGNIYYYRWGDAPIHTLAIYIFSKKFEIFHINYSKRFNIKWDYVVILLILIACLILDILLLMYLNSIINEIYEYKDKIEDKINDEDIEDYMDKFKKVMDYFCDKMIEC